MSFSVCDQSFEGVETLCICGIAFPPERDVRYPISEVSHLYIDARVSEHWEEVDLLEVRKN